jgi:hypothetical protein
LLPLVVLPITQATASDIAFQVIKIATGHMAGTQHHFAKIIQHDEPCIPLITRRSGKLNGQRPFGNAGSRFV